MFMQYVTGPILSTQNIPISFSVCYLKSVSFIEFRRNFCIKLYDNTMLGK